jgi:hypothetical protein
MPAEPQAETQDLTPLNVIRSETVLSRYPVHRLAKRGQISIEIRRQNQDGEVLLNWEVSHNSRHGQPGPLAYKLDTLVINRRIDEAGKPLPLTLCLGSLRDVCEELGLYASGQNIAHVKRALRQNAFAAVTAKVRYRGLGGEERSVEINDTRYGVVFTGEKLPGGRRADAVYVVLHEFYREVLNNTVARPLDYDYLKSLPPAPQRFYELISYQVYAALKHKRPRAKYLYSEYCAYAPQTRYFDYEHVKKQMYKIHTPHRRSGYIEDVEFVATTDGVGEPDWIMFYTPGRKARAEHEAFGRRRPTIGQTEKGNERALATSGGQSSQRLLPSGTAQFTEDASPEIDELVSKLKGLGVSDRKALDLVMNKREAVNRQLSALPFRYREKNKKNPAGWIVSAIENDYELPEAYNALLEGEQQAKQGRAEKAKREDCTFCGPSGFRYMKGRGVKKCSHDPTKESKYPGDPC